MKHKPIRIDWDELESAFENPNEELVYYLDTVTGQVFLEGEGEEDDDDDDGMDLTRRVSGTDRPAAGSSRVAIRPVRTEMKVEWFRSFVRDVEDLEEEILARLNQALEAEDPAPELILVLREHPECQERWYLYRADRTHELIDAWLEEKGVRVIEPPPWAGD